MAKDRLSYIRHKMANHDLEELFEHFNIEPEEVFMILQNGGHIDLDEIMEDEWFEEETEEDDE